MAVRELERNGLEHHGPCLQIDIATDASLRRPGELAMSLETIHRRL